MSCMTLVPRESAILVLGIVHKHGFQGVLLRDSAGHPSPILPHQHLGIYLGNEKIINIYHNNFLNI